MTVVNVTLVTCADPNWSLEKHDFALDTHLLVWCLLSGQAGSLSPSGMNTGWSRRVRGVVHCVHRSDRTGHAATERVDTGPALHHLTCDRQITRARRNV